MTKRSFLSLVVILYTLPAIASVPPTFSYQGKLLNEHGNSPITASVQISLGIYNPTGDCLLYEESQHINNLSQTAGSFSVKVGSNVNDPKRTENDPNLSMVNILGNGKQFRPENSPNCSAGYTPQAEHGRKLKVKVSIGGNPFVSLSPDMDLSPVPYSIIAGSVQGENVSSSNASSGQVLTADGEGKAIWADLPQSANPNGYVKLPGGLIMQWGNSAATCTAHTYTSSAVTFPIPFPNYGLWGIANVRDPERGYNAVHPLSVVNGVAVGKNSLTIGISSGGISANGDCGVLWMAIGK